MLPVRLQPIALLLHRSSLPSIAVSLARSAEMVPAAKGDGDGWTGCVVWCDGEGSGVSEIMLRSITSFGRVGAAAGFTAAERGRGRAGFTIVAVRFMCWGGGVGACGDGLPVEVGEGGKSAVIPPKLG
ncbi:hypothetical protein BGX38DRAFT_1206396 [Terfezia claveryi]|nr:hypothetical protein BGX38DRAFT_1206396 [Terfezia claveryi]